MQKDWHRARDSRQISSLGRAEPETLSLFHHGGAQSLRLSANVKIPCTEPETLGSFHARGAQSLRLSAIFIVGRRRASDSPLFFEGRAEPETVSKFHHGCAQSLRRSAIRIGGGPAPGLEARFELPSKKKHVFPNGRRFSQFLLPGVFVVFCRAFARLRKA